MIESLYHIKMLVYMIKNKTDPTLFYIGECRDTFEKMISNHKCKSKYERYTAPLYVKIRETSLDDYDVTIIDVCTGDATELHAMAVRYIKDLKPPMNANAHTGDRTQANKKYREKNAEAIAKYQAEWRGRNPDYAKNRRDALNS